MTGLVVDLGLMHGAGIEDVDAQGDGFGLAITIEDGCDTVLYVTELWIVADGLARLLFQTRIRVSLDSCQVPVALCWKRKSRPWRWKV